MSASNDAILTEIPLRHEFQGRWLTRVNAHDATMVFRERAGNIEKVTGCLGVTVGIAVSFAAVYCGIQYHAPWESAAIFAVGLLYIAAGIGKIYPRKGFLIDTAKGFISIW